MLMHIKKINNMVEYMFIVVTLLLGIISLISVILFKLTKRISKLEKNLIEMNKDLNMVSRTMKNNIINNIINKKQILKG
jgi:hypothetical protein